MPSSSLQSHRFCFIAGAKLEQCLFMTREIKLHVPSVTKATINWSHLSKLSGVVEMIANQRFPSAASRELQNKSAVIEFENVLLSAFVSHWQFRLAIGLIAQVRQLHLSCLIESSVEIYDRLTPRVSFSRQLSHSTEKRRVIEWKSKSTW